MVVGRGIVANNHHIDVSPGVTMDADLHQYYTQGLLY